MNDHVFYAATKILAAQCAGGKGEGMHLSPKLVAQAVDLAEMLAAEIAKREAADVAPPAAIAIGPADPAQPPVPPS